ncbi:hypothetical protein DPX16_15235 [Anabarilius grahami]|uniref:Uncharacterized protein n=1 Tax=Anabarilius grahami TaxID=495550 RepID=A0A3N0XVF3_ANAGA|nr:hypothetical protein DPX16_15235 [Anabarilius grahami]
MENILCFSVAARALRIGAYGFINKAQFYTGFTDRLKLKDGAVTVIMIPVMSRNRRCPNGRLDALSCDLALLDTFGVTGTCSRRVGPYMKIIHG